MTTVNNNSSTLRTKKFRESMIKQGFKCVQKWVFDIENAAIQEQIRRDLANYKPTKEEKGWNELASERLRNLEGWK